MQSMSPFSLSSRDGTVDRGARSDTIDCARSVTTPAGWSWRRGGEDERIPVLEVGIGVGYLTKEAGPLGLSRAILFNGLGRPGDDEGSKGGSKVGAGRFLDPSSPETGGKEGSPDAISLADFTGEELILPSVETPKEQQEEQQRTKVGWWTTMIKALILSTGPGVVEEAECLVDVDERDG